MFFFIIPSLIFGERPALICVINEIFSLNLINPIELYAFANETNLPLTNFINQFKSQKLYSHLAATLKLNFSQNGSVVP